MLEGDKAESPARDGDPAGGRRAAAFQRHAGRRGAGWGIRNIDGSLRLQSATRADPFRREGKSLDGHRGAQIPPEVRETRTELLGRLRW